MVGPDTLKKLITLRVSSFRNMPLEYFVTTHNIKISILWLYYGYIMVILWLYYTTRCYKYYIGFYTTFLVQKCTRIIKNTRCTRRIEIKF